jgi:hypothetical protein
MEEIKLIQEPIIKHDLYSIGKMVTARLQKLNIDNLVATNETIKSLKQLRADLNKEFTSYESQRKTIKNGVSNPYIEFENIYKSEISEKYKEAVSILKDTIADFENKVKAKKKANIERYFSELCTANNIDFLKFSDTGLEINLSTTENKYKEQCDAFVNRINDDIILINTMQYPAEIMAEYKKNSLNASLAIKTITDRKEDERLEAERIRQKEIHRREDMIRSLSMVYHDITKTFNYIQDESIMIEQKEIEKFSKEDFQKCFVEIENKIKANQADLFSQQQNEPEESKKEAHGKDTDPEAKQPSEPLQAPVKEKFNPEEKKVKAAFECEGTYFQLKALGQYMKDNGIIYKNI